MISRYLRYSLTSLLLFVNIAVASWYTNDYGNNQTIYVVTNIVSALNERIYAANGSTLSTVATELSVDPHTIFFDKDTYKAAWQAAIALGSHYVRTNLFDVNNSLDTYLATNPGVYRADEVYVWYFDPNTLTPASGCLSVDLSPSGYRWRLSDYAFQTASDAPYTASDTDSRSIFYATDWTSVFDLRTDIGAITNFDIYYTHITNTIDPGFISGNYDIKYITNTVSEQIFTNTIEVVGLATTTRAILFSLWTGVYDGSTVVRYNQTELPDVPSYAVDGTWKGLLDKTVYPAIITDSTNLYSFRVDGYVQSFADPTGTIRRAKLGSLLTTDPHYIDPGYAFPKTTGVLAAASEIVSVSNTWAGLTNQFVAITNVTLLSVSTNAFTISTCYTQLYQYGDAPAGAIAYSHQIEELVKLLTLYRYTARYTYTDAWQWSSNNENTAVSGTNSIGITPFRPSTPLPEVYIRGIGDTVLNSCSGFGTSTILVNDYLYYSSYAYPRLAYIPVTNIYADVYFYGKGQSQAPAGCNDFYVFGYFDSMFIITNCVRVACKLSTPYNTSMAPISFNLPAGYVAGNLQYLVSSGVKPGAVTNNILGGKIGSLDGPTVPVTTPDYTVTSITNLYGFAYVNIPPSSACCAVPCYYSANTAIDIFTLYADGLRVAPGSINRPFVIFDWDFVYQ